MNVASDAAAPPYKEPEKPVSLKSRSILLRAAAIAAGAFAACGLFSRIMMFPLRHDEQFYLPISILFSTHRLYEDIAYNHLPNLPILLSVFFKLAPDWYVLVGRLTVFLAWVGLAGALIWIGWKCTKDWAMTSLSALLILTNTAFLGPAGMIATNNIMPTPFALLALAFFIAGATRAPSNPALMFASGLCVALAIGFKVSYVFLAPPFALAALLAPRRLPSRERIVKSALPFASGGMAGSIPILYYALSDPHALVAETFRWHRIAHLAYWTSSDLPKVMSLGEKFLLAESVWFSGAALLVPLLVAVLAVILIFNRSPKSLLEDFTCWPVLLTASLVALGAVVSFVPTPSFPQYFIPPVAFGVTLAMTIFGRLNAQERGVARTFAVAASLIALMTGGSRLVSDLGRLADFSQWTGVRVHRVSAGIAEKVRAHGRHGRVATLSPVYALEGGLEIYPELAAGQVIYRTANYIPERDRRYFRMVGEAELPGLLEADPPSAILVGLAGAEDKALIAYALSHGYTRHAVGESTRYGTLTLFIAPE